jgi:hypothetical protein
LSPKDVFWRAQVAHYYRADSTINTTLNSQGGRVLRLFIFVFLLASASSGQAEEKSGAVLSIEDLLIKPKEWTLSPSFGLSTDQSGNAGVSSQAYSNSFNLNYGVNRDLAVSWQYSSQRLVKNETRVDASVQTIGLRWRIQTQGAWHWNVSAHREIQASHSATGLDWARPAYTVSIQTYRFIDPLVLSSSFGYHKGSRWRIGDELSPQSQRCHWSVALDFAVNRVVGLYSSYQVSREVFNQSDTVFARQRLSLGGSYRISEDTSLALTLGFGLADETPATLSVQGRYRF